MWRYRKLFRLAAEKAADRILGYLDTRLAPSVLLVGLPVPEGSEAVWPEVEPHMVGLARLLAEALEGAPQDDLGGDPDTAGRDRWHHTAQARRIFGHAVERVLEQRGGADGRVSFAAEPALVQGHFVCVVLQVDEAAYDAHYQLTPERHAGARSLLDAAIKEFLAGCTMALYGQRPSANLDALGRNYEEIVRTAGRYLMITPAEATGGGEHAGVLFDTLNAISSLRYEGAESVGRLLIAPRAHPGVEPLVIFRKPVPLESYRAARKMLEMATESVYLLSDARFIYGLGELRGSYDPGEEDLFEVRFTRHHTWELAHGPHTMMRATYGQAHLPRERIDETRFRASLSRIFGVLPGAAADRLWQITLAASLQQHGTIVVISAGAAAEAVRLTGQSTAVEPMLLEPAYVSVFTAIDGALLVDPQGHCHAIGVILDGTATGKGSAARGARYNSAVRYVETFGEAHPSLAVVVSADGTIDLVPDLRPRIRRAAIDAVLQKLRVVGEQATPDEHAYQELMKWLEAHRFYLTADVCAEVNALKRAIDVRLFRQDPTGLRMNRPNFEPHEEMSARFFFDE